MLGGLTAEGEHALETGWRFWYYDTGVTIKISEKDQTARLSTATKDYVSHLHALNCFSTVEGFFRYGKKEEEKADQKEETTKRTPTHRGGRGILFFFLVSAESSLPSDA